MYQNIAIIGAGPMGLSLAYELLKKGNRVTIYESDSVIGGMSASFDFSGTRIERYYHFICAGDYPLFEILDELGIKDKLKWQKTRMGFYYDGKLNDWGNPIALLKFPGVGLVSKFRYGMHAFFSVKKNDWKPLDREEATSWIKKWIGEKAYNVWWKNLFELKFYDYAKNLSAAWIWTRIKRVGSSRYDLFNEKLGYLDGGSEILLEALRTRIDKMGGKIYLNSRVQKIHIENNTVSGIEIGGELFSHDAVASTVPVPYIHSMVPDLPKEIALKFQNLQNIAVVCIIVKLKKPVTENFWVNINDPRMDIPGIVEYTNLLPLKHHIVYVPFYLPGEHPKYQDSDEIFFGKVKKYLMTINSKIAEDDFLDIRASRYRYAQPICGPGYLNSLPPVSLPLRGLFAADTSYYYPEDRGISESLRFSKEMAKTILKDGPNVF